MGLTASPTLVAVQSVVGWDRRGVVTGTNMFFRSMGSAIGAALFGAIANVTLSTRFTNPPGPLVGRLPHSVDATSTAFAPHGMAQPSAVAEFIRVSLFQAAHNVFVALLAVAVVATIAVLVIPRRTVPLVFDA